MTRRSERARRGGATEALPAGELRLSGGTGGWRLSGGTGGLRLSGGTGERRWVLVAALASGCCAPQPGSSEPPPPVTGAAEGGAPVVVEEFVAIDGEEARRRLWPEPAPRAYVAADEATQAALGGLVRAMLATPSPAPSALAGAAAAAGFLVEGWTIAGQRYLVARELADRRGGGGAYVVRVDGRSSVILEAPHGFFDLGTERIALEMFLAADERGWPRALFVNTVHRYLGADGVKRRQPESPADPCHSAGHLLAVATATAVEVVPGVEVVQLHGFGDDEAAEGMPAAIVSGGLAQAATVRSRVVAERLRSGLGIEVGLFPVNTDRLGATTNVQGRVIHAREGASFVHVEMSAGLRQRLLRDPAAQAALGAALRGDATGQP